MALPRPISSTQTDAKSPVDDNLMDSIRIDLDYLDSQITGGSGLFCFNVNGPLRLANNLKGEALDTALYYTEFAPGVCRAILKKSGLSGKLKFDLRKAIATKTPITGIESLFIGSTQNIARVATPLNTQSITRSQSTTAVQSLTYAKSALSIISITDLGEDFFKYNFSGSLLDADYQIGQYILISGATNANNDGLFEILEVNNSGFSSIVVSNALGVEQTGAAGTGNLTLFSYNFVNPANSDFVVGEDAFFSSMTNGVNNGSKEIYKVNELGNNLWCYVPSGVTEGLGSGTADVSRWVFLQSSSVNTSHFVIGENALLAGHTNPSNDGNKKIVDINRTGNNVVIYNSAGVAQGGAAGTTGSNRWIYSFSTDPSVDIDVGDEVYFKDHTTAANNGIFTVVIVNISSLNNVVIYNEAGVAQAGILGTGRTTLKKVKFSSDQSANYTTDESFIEMEDTVSGLYRRASWKEQFLVLDVNYGGGANYNVIIDGQDYPEQPTAAGFIHQEMKSIFIAPPEEVISTIGNTEDRTIRIQSSNFVAANILTTETLYLYLLEIPEGTPRDLTVWLQ
jgi:hypothetical protein